MKLKLPIFNYCSKCGARISFVEAEGRCRPVCGLCGNIVYLNPVPAAALAVLNNGKILLTLRNIEPQKGMWCLPGGFLEWGESPEDGASRELLEETGLTVKSLELLGVYNSITGINRHVIVIGYFVSEWSGDPWAGDDAEEVDWFDISGMPPLAFLSHMEIVKELIKRKI